MLERIVDRLRFELDFETDESRDRRQRNPALKELKQFCVEQGLGFYSQLMKKLPDFYEEVNRYIEERARRDLPVVQFGVGPRHMVADINGLDDFAKEHVEIGGVLGYDGHLLFEMGYSPPDQSVVTLEIEIYKVVGDRRLYDERLLISSTSHQPIQLDGIRERFNYATVSKSSTPSIKKNFIRSEDIARSNAIIDWHSHPSGFSALSEGDIKYNISRLGIFGDKPIFFVVYSPARNQTYWYQMIRSPTS